MIRERISDEVDTHINGDKNIYNMYYIFMSFI